MRSAFQEPIRNDSNSMSASTRSREARQVLSRIFPWLRPRLQPPEQERLSSRDNRWGVWANGWGDWVSVSNDGFAKGYDFTTGGFITGVDYRITDHFAVGLMGATRIPLPIFNHPVILT